MTEIKYAFKVEFEFNEIVKRFAASYCLALRTNDIHTIRNAYYQLQQLQETINAYRNKLTDLCTGNNENEQTENREKTENV